MNFSAKNTVLLISAILLISGSAGAETNAFNNLSQLMDSARVVGGSTFAPKAMKKSEQEFMKARQAVQSNRSQKTINKHVSKASEFAEHALKAMKK